MYRRPLKYRNQPLTVDGQYFHSRGEYRHWCQLQLLAKAGEIQELRRQVRYDLNVNGVKVGHFTPDFQWVEAGKGVTIADWKSAATREDKAYKFRKRLFEAIYGLTVQELGVAPKVDRRRKVAA